MSRSERTVLHCRGTTRDLLLGLSLARRELEREKERDRDSRRRDCDSPHGRMNFRAISIVASGSLLRDFGPPITL